MESEEQRAQRDSTPRAEEHAHFRPLVKSGEPRSERISGDHIHLSPRAQRRMAMARRSGY